MRADEDLWIWRVGFDVDINNQLLVCLKIIIDMFFKNMFNFRTI